MADCYFDLMEKTLSAYTDDHIRRYFDQVKRDGLSEHGFPRLTSDIGILIANGRRPELCGLFCEMMEFCCRSIPRVKAANDFSVREILSCIAELEKSEVVAAGDIARWKELLASIEPYQCYNVIAKTPTDPVRNWALFTGVSEFYRQRMGLCDSAELVDVQIASQLQWLDENGMYMDNGEGDVHQPMVYDMVPRVLFALLLHGGYRGRYYEEIDACLQKAGLLTLNMQSVTGELAFGGRSNQFVHNEAWLAAMLEYEAARYQRNGDTALAGRFKAAALRALENAGYWLAKDPITHVKNRFPVDSKYGCENYAYFDKYMITAASYFYVAHLFCDDAITPAEPDDVPVIWQSSGHFHKIFARAGGYALEFDTNADPHYDASGLGRVHKAGAPSTICLSVPCPVHPRYRVDVANPVRLTLCPGIRQDGAWQFATEPSCRYELLRAERTDDAAVIELSCRFENQACVRSKYTVDESGVRIEVCGENAAFMLPAFVFDGKTHTELAFDEQRLTVSYEGWQCRYTTSGKIAELGGMAANRNGHYRAYYAAAPEPFWVRIEILEQK